MEGIIVAVGCGSRMKEVTRDQPKCLLKRQVKAMLGVVVSETFVIIYCWWVLLGTHGLVAFQDLHLVEATWLSFPEGPKVWLELGRSVVRSSDPLCTADGVRSFIECSAPAATYEPSLLAMWIRDFGRTRLEAETSRPEPAGRLLEIGNKLNTVGDVQGTCMGWQRFTPQAWRYVLVLRAALAANERDRMHMTGTLQRFITAGQVPVVGVPYAGEWGEVDSPEDFGAYAGSAA